MPCRGSAAGLSPLTSITDRLQCVHDTNGCCLYMHVQVWAPCAKVLITSILGDSVEDSVCCSSGELAAAAVVARLLHFAVQQLLCDPAAR
jgi:hypothetical protein